MSSDWDPDWDVYDMISCLYDDDGCGPCGNPAVAWFILPKVGRLSNHGTQDRVSVLCARHAGIHGAQKLGAVPTTLDELAAMQVMET